MNFAFVSMEYQELGPLLKNEKALVILDQDNQPSYVAHEGSFKQLGRWIPDLSRDMRDRIIQHDLPFDMKFEPYAFAKIIGSSRHNNLCLNYESWQEGTIAGEKVEPYNPISVSPFVNPQQELVFADITVYANDLWRSGGYASKERVRNKSALVCINAESEIIFIAQAHKFRKVSPEELFVHKLPQNKESLNYDTYGGGKYILFDHLRRSWKK